MFTGTYELIKNSIGKTSVKKAVVASPVESLSAPARFFYNFKNKEPKFGASSVCLSWSAFIKAGKGVTVNYESHDPNKMAVISHTGGTTGEPKGVMCSDKNITSLICQIGSSLPHNRQEIYMSVLPPFINYSLVNSMLEPLTFGFKVVLIPSYQPQNFHIYIKKYRPNHISSIPAYWEAILANKHLLTMDLSCLRHIYYGGDAMNEQQEKAVNSLLISRGAQYKLSKGLGSTEMISAATITYDDCNQVGSVGVPLVSVNCQIVNPETNEELSYGQVGEICFSGETVMLGYYRKPNETSEIVHIHADGNRWLHTGDLGHITEDGIIYVTGRIKRIIMTKGDDGQVTKMFPDRIEKAVLKHPSVRLCCVIGVEDEKRIHYPKAIIVLNCSYEKSDATTAEILATCKENLPNYMVPEMIEYRDDLPRTSRGKVDYRALEQEAKC